MRPNLKQIAFLYIFFAVASLLQALPSYGSQQQYKPHGNQPTINNSGLTPVVFLFQSFVSSNEQENSAEGNAQHWYDWFWPPEWATWAVVIVAIWAGQIALRTVVAIEAQIKEMQNAGVQTNQMITHANQQAIAVEKVAKTIAENSKQQMRAYLNVTIGSGAFQERVKDIRFAGYPVVTNTGNTPAHKVSIIVRAGIFPVPLPDSTVLPTAIDVKSEGVVGPHQNVILSGVMNDFVPDANVEMLKTGGGPDGVYIWGQLTYEDAFSEFHTTNFCYLATYLPSGNVWGYFWPGRNHAD